MKKIKKFYKEHRVFTILMAVALVCLIVIITVLINLFGYGSGNSMYGNRLEGIENVEISDSKKTDVESLLVADPAVNTAKVFVQGKIIYVNITFTEGVDLNSAEGFAVKCLEQFSEEEKAFYDFQFTLKKEKTENADGFLISGAKNATGSGLVWNNNNPVEVVTEEAE